VRLRPWAVSLAACLLLARPVCASPGFGAPYPVFVDGVRVDKRGGSVLERGKTAFIEAVRAVRIFDGLLSFGDRAKIVRITIDRRTMNFVVGQKTAYLEGAKIVLPAAPFTSDGDVYLPLTTIAKLGSSRVVVDRMRHIASFRLGGGDDFPMPHVRRDDSADDQPSPSEALSIVTSATIDAKGLHASANIRNTTIVAYKLAFPTAKQIAFVLSRNGEEVWDSTADTRGARPTTIVIGALENKTVTATDPDFEKLGAGRYLLRLRLQTLIPLDLPPISIGEVTPSPSSTR